MPGYPFNIFYPNSGYAEAPAGQIIAGASNIRTGDNPAFLASDFLTIYPQFKNATTPPPTAGTGYDEGLCVPDAVYDMIYTEANSKLQQSRWRSQWKRGICNYIAHYITMYLATTTGHGVPGLLNASAPMLLKTSKSVGDVSSGYDASTIMQDILGYADLKSTTYGVQLATAAKLISKGGMAIW